MATTREKIYLGIIAGLLLLVGGMAGAFFVGAVGMRTEPAMSVVTEDAPSLQTPEALLGIQPPAIKTADAIIVLGKTDPQAVASITFTIGKTVGTATISLEGDGSWTIQIPRNTLPEQPNIQAVVTLGLRDGTMLQTVQTIVVPASLGTDQAGTETAVAWRAAPIPVTTEQLAATLGIPQTELEDDVPSQFYSVGTVLDGKYKGNDFIVVLTDCDGPCFDPLLWRAIVDPVGKHLVNLALHGTTEAHMFGSDVPYQGSYPNLVALTVDDYSIHIPGLDLPKTVTLSGSSYQLALPESVRTRFVLGTEWESVQSKEQQQRIPKTTTLIPLQKTTDDRTIFQVEDGGGCLVLQQPDFSFTNYDLVLPFQEKGLDITWKEGVRNAVQYDHADVGGCGQTNCYAVRSEAVLQPATRLVEVGTTSNGESVYGLKDPNDKEYADFLSTNSYNSYAADGHKMTMAELVSGHGIIYWKDPFNRWVRFTRSDFLPMAECGKPVIYLYPEQAMPVHVSVGLRGVMSVSEPSHGAHGWNVVAQTDGTVVNQADGRTYPNLFWEGAGVHYTMPKEGFVIRGTDTDAWLTKTLATIGFTERESGEFREFWIPRLPKTPYLFLTFIPQEHFDRDAPLLITPRPDSVSRVFMEYRGLEAPISVPPLTLPKIVRNGFTVVEWGGALR